VEGQLPDESKTAATGSAPMGEGKRVSSWREFDCGGEQVLNVKKRRNKNRIYDGGDRGGY